MEYSKKELESLLEKAAADGLIEYKTGYPLSKVSSFGIGGEADYAVWPGSIKALCALNSEINRLGIYCTVIGNGTNILFSDKGFNGAVIITSKINSTDIFGTEIEAGCGVSLTRLSSLAAEKGLTGLEFAYGIPGSVGGAVYMNAGAFDSEISAVVKSVTWFDPTDCSTGIYSGGDNMFGYRRSIYQNGKKLILSARFSLQNGSKEEIRRKMDSCMQKRKDKQPLEFPSAGSTFKRYPGYFTGKIIEEAGLKGLTVGGAQVSEKHAGFVINRGNATAEDVLELIRLIKEKIYEIHGINLECEIRMIPYSNF